MSAPVYLLRFGPRCGDAAAFDSATAGFDVVGRRRVRELEPLAPHGAVIVVGHVPHGLGHIVERIRRTLPRGHRVVAVRPCEGTRPFWDGAGWSPVESVAPGAEPVEDLCFEREPLGILRPLLERPTNGSPSGMATTVMG